jgi:tripartite-type tricarboxylate transporter receptor subunit TctC
MHQDVTRALTEAEIRKHLIGYGADPLTVTPEEMGKRIRSETAAWAKVIQRSSIRFE